MTDCVAQYKNDLKKHLRCCGGTQTRLLKKFDQSLSAFLEESPPQNKEELCAAFGPPKDMAELLMAEITPEEVTRYRRSILIKRITVGILAALFLTFTVYIYFCKNIPNEMKGEVIIIDEVPSPTTETDQVG